MSGRQDALSESRKKGVIAGVAAAGAVTVGVLGFPIVAGVAAVPAVVLAWNWWQHRAKNGIRF